MCIHQAYCCSMLCKARGKMAICCICLLLITAGACHCLHYCHCVYDQATPIKCATRCVCRTLLPTPSLFSQRQTLPTHMASALHSESQPSQHPLTSCDIIPREFSCPCSMSTITKFSTTSLCITDSADRTLCAQDTAEMLCSSTHALQEHPKLHHQ